MPKFPFHVEQLAQVIFSILPYHKKQLQNTLKLLKQEELDDLESYLVNCLHQGLSIHYLAQCYETIMSSVLLETAYFQKYKTYRHSKFEEVANEVYYNNTFMSAYMYGVLITLFFWPNHLNLYRFFCKTLPRNKLGHYLEIGPGHGYFFKKAVELGDFESYLGIDLSNSSIQQTKNLLASFSHEKKVNLYCEDFFNFPFEGQQFDALVMGEVLEHVERPQDFLKKIASLAKKDSYIFITTCLHAPIVDHIYEFNNLEEIEHLFLENGLIIKEAYILPYLDKTLEECLTNLLTINVGYVLEKK